MQDLLFELGCEELPANGLKVFAEQFAQQLITQLQQATLAFKSYHYYVTPRRIAIVIKELAFSQPNQQIVKRGPALQAPEAALQGFMRSINATPEQILQKDNYWYVQQTVIGKNLFELLPNFIKQTFSTMTGNKWMHWGQNTQPFWRPVNWLVLLWGEQVIPAQFFNCKTDRITYSHRWQQPQKLTIAHANYYSEFLLEEGRVIADFDTRQKNIEQQLLSKALAQQAQVLLNQDLLVEVTGLVEWPQVLLAKFDPHFLTVPKEVLILAMQQHQKCFALTNKSGELLPYFLTVSNVFTTETALIIEGNERVMHARLSDAAFFWQQDQQKSLLALATPLQKIIFQQQLGTLADKVKRLFQLSEIIAKWLQVDVTKAQQVAKWSKIDLTSDLVNEFPELQGFVGYYLAKHQGESEEIALAIRDQYLPLPQQVALPKNALGCVIALADRIDTLAGIFGIGLMPTGDKDPYALRRAAIGLIRLIIEKSLSHIYLDDLINAAFAQYNDKKYGNKINIENKKLLEQFIIDRLPAYFQELGYTAEMVAAVLQAIPTKHRSLIEIARRLEALSEFIKLPEAVALTSANKRVKNILRKADVAFSELSGKPATLDINNNLLELDAEKNLYKKITEQKDSITLTNIYFDKLYRLAAFKEPLEQFFNEVRVDVEEVALKNNRLALLQTVRTLFLQVADLSLLTVDK